MKDSLEEKVEKVQGNHGAEEEAMESRDMVSAVGKVQDPKAQQTEMIADQPCNRPQTKSNAAMDRKDIGSRGAGPVGNMEGGKGQPTR